MNSLPTPPASPTVFPPRSIWSWIELIRQRERAVMDSWSYFGAVGWTGLSAYSFGRSSGVMVDPVQVP